MNRQHGRRILIRRSWRVVGNTVGIIIPKSFMEELSLEPGTFFRASLENGKIVFEPLKLEPKEVEEV